MRTAPARPPRTPLLRRLLDGERTWGALEVSDRRYGMCRYRLSVYPPGLRRGERMSLRLWHAFPAWGLTLWLAVQIVGMTLTTPDTALALSTGSFVLAAVVAMILAGPARGDVRTLTVVRMVGVRDLDVLAKFHLLRALAERLVRADARLAAGELTAVEHEAEVWKVYDRLAS
jgi:hypothetical protein